MKKAAIVLSLIITIALAASIAYAAKSQQYDEAIRYYNKGKYAEAVRLMKEYVSTNPDPSAYYRIGYALYKMGKTDEANEYFNYSFMVDPMFSPGLANLPAMPGKIKMPKKEKTAEAMPAAPKVKTPAAQQPIKKKEVAAPAAKEAAKPIAPATPKAAPVVPAKTAPAAPIAQAKPVTPQPAAVKPAVAAPATPAAQTTPAPPAHVANTPEGHKQPAAAMQNTTAAMQNTATGAQAKKSPMPIGGATKPGTPDLGMMIALAGTAFLVAIAIAVLIYLIFSWFIFKIAKKLDVQPLWPAWIPVLQLWTLASAAGKPWWWVILQFVPLVNIVVMVIMWMSIAERLGKSKWLGLLILLPVLNIIIIAYLAFASSPHQQEETPSDMAFGADEPASEENPFESNASFGETTQMQESPLDMDNISDPFANTGETSSENDMFSGFDDIEGGEKKPEDR